MIRSLSAAFLVLAFLLMVCSIVEGQEHEFAVMVSCGKCSDARVTDVNVYLDGQYAGNTGHTQIPNHPGEFYGGNVIFRTTEGYHMIKLTKNDCGALFDQKVLLAGFYIEIPWCGCC
jgi:hypothetical protein